MHRPGAMIAAEIDDKLTGLRFSSKIASTDSVKRDIWLVIEHVSEIQTTVQPGDKLTGRQIWGGMDKEEEKQWERISASNGKGMGRWGIQKYDPDTHALMQTIWLDADYQLQPDGTWKEVGDNERV